MKTIVLVMFLAALAAAGFWYVTENDRADRERAYIRSLELKKESEARAREYEERKKAEDERMRKERAEALARDDAMRMFLRYIDREEVDKLLKLILILLDQLYIFIIAVHLVLSDQSVNSAPHLFFFICVQIDFCQSIDIFFKLLIIIQHV